MKMWTKKINFCSSEIINMTSVPLWWNSLKFPLQTLWVSLSSLINKIRIMFEFFYKIGSYRTLAPYNRHTQIRGSQIKYSLKFRSPVFLQIKCYFTLLFFCTFLVELNESLNKAGSIVGDPNVISIDVWGK